MNLNSPELLINVKRVPTTDSREYEDFWMDQTNKIRNGVTINGFTFSPYLYWHINLWSIYQDTEVNGRPIRKLDRPALWNSFLPVDEALTKAEDATQPGGRKGLAIVGSRRISKTVMITSKVSHQVVAYQNSEALVSAGNNPDLKVITDYLDLGLRELPQFFNFNRIENDWKKCVTLGEKVKGTDKKLEWSKIHVRNFDSGNNTEAAAGLTLSAFLLDEGGKFPFLRALIATLPCFDSPYGWRCSPMITATGGDMKLSNDMKELVYNPTGYNFLPVMVKDDNTQISLFVSATQSLQIKREPMPMSEYLNVSKGSELDDIIIHVSNEESATQQILDKRDQIKKASGMEEYLKYIMYYPLTVEECFLDVSENIFPAELLQQQLSFLESGAYKKDVTYVELYRDGNNEVRHRFTDDKPVASYPAKANEIKDGVVQIFEFPMADAPYGLYTAGMDPYKQSQAHYSTSLGALYIFKRVHDIGSERFQNMIVACYVGRPSKIRTWYDKARELLDFYGVKVLCENMDMGFIDYCIEKRDPDRYLERTPSILREEIHANTQTNRTYGIHSSSGIKDYINSLIIEYLTEVVEVSVNKETGEKKEILGVSRILDPMLIKELLAYNPKANADRKDAFGYALLMARNLARYGTVTDKLDSRYDFYNKIPARGMFSRKTKNPFRR